MKIFTFLLFTILTSGACAQVNRLLGYVQQVNAGMLPEVNQSGTPKQENPPGRYFLFAVQKSRAAVLYQQVWINGQAYTFTIDTVKKVPFVLETSNGGEMILRDTLVKQRGALIIRLNNLVPTDGKKLSASIERLVKAHAMVLVYSRQKKRMLQYLHRAAAISPLFTQ
jgi:hypothetical protein